MQRKLLYVIVVCLAASINSYQYTVPQSHMARLTDHTVSLHLELDLATSLVRKMRRGTYPSQNGSVYKWTRGKWLPSQGKGE